MSKQLSTFFESILKLRCGTALLTFNVNKWKKAVDNHQAFGAVLTDFLKASECLNHDLLVVKLLSDCCLLPFTNAPCRLLKEQETKNHSEIILYPL